MTKSFQFLYLPLRVHRVAKTNSNKVNKQLWQLNMTCGTTTTTTKSGKCKCKESRRRCKKKHKKEEKATREKKIDANRTKNWSGLIDFTYVSPVTGFSSLRSIRKIRKKKKKTKNERKSNIRFINVCTEIGIWFSWDKERFSFEIESEVKPFSFGI